MTKITCYEKFAELDAKYSANNGKIQIAQINVTISYNPTSPTFEIHKKLNTQKHTSNKKSIIKSYLQISFKELATHAEFKFR